MTYHGPWGNVREVIPRDVRDRFEHAMRKIDKRYTGFWDLGNGYALIEFDDGVTRKGDVHATINAAKHVTSKYLLKE